MTTTIIIPNEWHSKPEGRHDRQCPYCGAPGKLRGRHRKLPAEENGRNRFVVLRRVAGNLIEKLYVTTPKLSIMPHVRKRILDATFLLSRGLTMQQAGDKLGVAVRTLEDYQYRHPDLWKFAMAASATTSGEVLKDAVGKSTLFQNHGKLIRLAQDAAEQNQEPLFPKPNRRKMSLTAFVDKVYLPSRIDVTDEYAKILRSTITRINAFFGRVVTIDELNERDVCRYLKAFRRCVAARTVNNHRQRIVTFWQSAYDQGIAERPPRLGLVRKLPEELDPPEAWTTKDCNRLLSTAANWPGMVGDISAGAWWLSLLLTIYWTSCRIGSMLATPSSAFKGNGLLVRKQKNHRPQWYMLPASCREAIEETRPGTRELLWPHPWHARTVWTKMRQIVESAKLDCPRTGRQLFHRMRRTTLSLCAAVDPAIAQRQAGHADYSTTLKHYIDPRIARGRSAADVLPEPEITRPAPPTPPAPRRVTA